MFIKEHGAAAILLAIVFMSLGFLLGKATSSHGHHTGCQSSTTCTHCADEGVQHITPPIQSGEPGSIEHANEYFGGGVTQQGELFIWDGDGFKWNESMSDYELVH
jgi:hypothetical protein